MANQFSRVQRQLDPRAPKVLHQLVDAAFVSGLSGHEIALRAGHAADTLKSVKRASNCNVSTLVNMAEVLGYDVRLVQK